jgi:hypothetical protein
LNDLTLSKALAQLADSPVWQSRHCQVQQEYWPQNSYYL